MRAPNGGAAARAVLGYYYGSTVGWRRMLAFTGFHALLGSRNAHADLGRDTL